MTHLAPQAADPPTLPVGPAPPRGALLPLSPTAVLNYGLCPHDWYLMPEAYSEPLVVELLARFGIRPGDTVLDPFAGTGTTVTTAVLRGVHGVGLEINPFLCFAARVKLDWAVDLRGFERAMQQLLAQAEPLLDGVAGEPDPSAQADGDEPAMPRLHEWMASAVVRKVLILRQLIEQGVPERLRPHFLLALAAILRPASNMKLTAHAFGSQVRKADAPVYALFQQKIHKIFADLVALQTAPPLFGQGHIVQGDTRRADALPVPLLPAALAITSPPYLNNLDYTMQTRMELFFLRFVRDMADLRLLRKAMVVCDAKAMYKEVHDSAEVADVAAIQQIAGRLREAHAGKNWGWDYAFMTTQYFGGMVRMLRAVRPLLRPGAAFVLIVGDSAHSGVKVPVPDLFGELGERAGYHLRAINVIRRRRSTSHQFDLCESEVVLQVP